MASNTEAEKAMEVMMGQESVRCARLVEKDMINKRDVSAPNSTSLIPSLGNSSFNHGDFNRKQFAEQGVYYTPTNTYGYVYPGYDGAYSEWNNYFVSQDGFGMPYSQTAHLNFGSHPIGAAKGYYPTGRFSSLSHQGQGGQFARNAPSNIRSGVRTWSDSTRGSARDRFSLRRHSEVLSELICGPRANKEKGSLSSSDDKDSLNLLVNTDQYNLQDFQTKHEHAKFYMIKSYNEDDVHKSIKYSVWASTPSGNKKLDDAFHDAEAKMKENAAKCPIFLFFSVNTSGKFIGVAEMMGPVDFKKSMNFWQEERWNGFFPVKWHIVKDVPNVEFRSIILENNDNRPVFFSRDTQEIRLPQGLQMLQIFKNYHTETSILDDFGFYDVREKSLRARRSCIPALARQEGEREKNYSSMLDLEEAMKSMEVLSARPKKATADLMKSSLAATKKTQSNAPAKTCSSQQAFIQ